MRSLPRILGICAVFGSVFAVSARPLTPAEALNAVRASESGAKHLPSLKRTASPSVTFNDDAGVPAVYVFGDGNGFSIIAADSDVPRMLLGYSDGETDTDSILNPAAKWWVELYAAQIGQMRSGALVDPRITEIEGRQSIPTLMTTRWNQLPPYNDKCPLYNINSTSPCPTGCVATAMAQVIKYHNYPVNGVGTRSYRWMGRNLTFDYENTTFDWDNMLDEYTDSATAEQRDAVATLMYGCGVGVSMSYGPSASSASMTDAARAIMNYFGFSHDIRLLDRDFYSLLDWSSILYAELEAGRPVLYSGRNSSAGHAFVIDGFSNPGYFHLNWGWGGSSNGYFRLTALDPMAQGVGGSTSGYNVDQQMIVGIRPDDGTLLPFIPQMQFNGGFTVGAQSYDRGENVQVQFGDKSGIFNASLGPVELTLGVKLVDIDDSTFVAYSSAPAIKSLVYGEGFRNYTVPASAFPVSGEYTVTPAFRDTLGNWHDALISMDVVRSLYLRCTRDSLFFEPIPQATIKATDFKLQTPIVAGHKFQLTATLEAIGGEYYGTITPRLLQNGVKVSSATGIMVDLFPNAAAPAEWITTIGSTSKVGDYQLALFTRSGVAVSDTIDIYISPDSPAAVGGATTPAVIGRGDGKGTLDNPYYVDIANFESTFVITGVSGYFSYPISGYIHDTNGLLLTSVGEGFVGLWKGDVKRVYANGDLSDRLDPEPTYAFRVYANGFGHLGNFIYFRDLSQKASMEGEKESCTRVTVDHMAKTVNVVNAAPLAYAALYNGNGAECLRTTLDGNTDATIQLSELNSGVYILELRGTDGTRTVHKIVM